VTVKATGNDSKFQLLDQTYTVACGETVTATILPAVKLSVAVISDADASGTVTSNPAGIDCRDSCMQVLAAGSTVTLTAIPDEGISFYQWNANCQENVSGSPTCTVVLNQDLAVTAQFSQQPSAYPAAHPSLPQIQNQQGPVLVNPKIIPVIYSSDPLKADIPRILTQLVSSTYWGSVTSEYVGLSGQSIGAATLGQPIVIADAAPGVIGDSQIPTFLTSMLDGPNPPWGQPDPNAVYALYYPADTTVVLGDGTIGCNSFYGYHWNFTLPQSQQIITYAVIPRCNFAVGNAAPKDRLSITSSHELVEAVTDPHYTGAPAYAGVDQDHLAWQLVLGQETGDLCHQVTQFIYTPQDMTYPVQRIWSNRAAAMGKDPCQPEIAGQTYFNSGVVVSDQVTFMDGSGATVATKGIYIPAPDYNSGTAYSQTVDLQLYSDGPTAGPWNVSVSDFSESNHDYMDFKLDKTSGVNGDTIHLTIVLKQTNVFIEAEPFYIQSELNGVKHYWFGLVGHNLAP
jgi:hypothetical protein